MKVQRMLAAVLITAVMLTGCTSLSLSGSDILAPPKASGSRAEILNMIEQDAKGSYSLIYPDAGAYKSGIIEYDIDGDGTDDAIAMYTTSDNTPRLLIATKNSDSYVLRGSVQLRSANVSEVLFADIDGDQTGELIIGCDAHTSLSSIGAYLFENDIVSVDIAEGFNDYLIGDFDGDGSADILLMTPASEQNTAKARLITFTDGIFGEMSSCEIDASIGSYVDLRTDNISEDIVGAVADGMLESGEYTTQLLYYDTAAQMLVNPLFMNASYSESVRSTAVCCADIDDDGVIEVPLCSLMEHGKDEDPADVCTLTRWSVYNPDLMALSVKQDAVMCDRLGFMLMFDSEQPGALTARYTADNAVTLYRVSYKNSEPAAGEELLTVKRYDKRSFDSSLTAEANLYESTAYTYTYILSEGSPLTHEQIIDSFKLVEPADANNQGK